MINETAPTDASRQYAAAYVARYGHWIKRETGVMLAIGLVETKGLIGVEDGHGYADAFRDSVQRDGDGDRGADARIL